MTLSDSQVAELKRAINIALRKVYDNDFSLIIRQAHERSIVFRFGLYFSEILTQTSFGEDGDLVVDFDYNRNYNGVKNMHGFDAVHGVFPDIILHKRESNDKNVVVMEFKGYWHSNGQGDHQKLCGFTNQEENDYRYGLGVFIKLDRLLETCRCVYYREGLSERVN